MTEERQSHVRLKFSWAHYLVIATSATPAEYFRGMQQHTRGEQANFGNQIGESYVSISSILSYELHHRNNEMHAKISTLIDDHTVNCEHVATK